MKLKRILVTSIGMLIAILSLNLISADYGYDYPYNYHNSYNYYDNHYYPAYPEPWRNRYLYYYPEVRYVPGKSQVCCTINRPLKYQTNYDKYYKQDSKYYYTESNYNYNKKDSYYGKERLQPPIIYVDGKRVA